LLDLTFRRSIEVFLSFIPLERPESHGIEPMARMRGAWRDAHATNLVLCKQRHGLVVYVRGAVTPEQNTRKRLRFQ
jgi:hypothetical protein